MKIQFEVIGKPQGKQRPRMNRFGHVYTPLETKEYENQIRSSFHKVKPKNYQPIDKPVIVEIEAFFVKAKSNKMKYCTIRPDLDNITKVVLDAIQGKENVIMDDKQVIGIVVRKYWGIVNKITVTVETVED